MVAVLKDSWVPFICEVQLVGPNRVPSTLSRVEQVIGHDRSETRFARFSRRLLHFQIFWFGPLFAPTSRSFLVLLFLSADVSKYGGDNVLMPHPCIMPAIVWEVTV